ncbi:DUF1553 domain-containing protein [Candidatus Laterigemmans baculatus]|nr:DUF1553 domain-containing protein [Candidatus Laterigemmans baculatus]
MHPTRPLALLLGALAAVSPLASASTATAAEAKAAEATASPAQAAGLRTFERDVRPILKTHCFHCHGESGVTEGALDVRLRRWLIRGGDSGEAILPGDADGSLLLERIESGEMPPGETKLSDEEITSIRDWITQGATTAREEPESLDGGDYITEEERNFWAFQPIRRPAVPEVGEIPQVGGPAIPQPIDAFILERLHRDGLALSEPADRRTLIRRATFDLWGLPPEPEMVEAFVHDEHPRAYENLIDRLLASPRYGERWGRHWLDVAGYADSDGYTNEDVEREFAYFYRDYVIDSFNSNKPLDQFIREQLAGDEMAGDEIASGDAELTPERIAQLAATGFLRMAPDGTASGGIDRDLAINETIADTLEIVSTSLLGLTVGCARCHDHRYDPISQADYFRLRAIFEPALDWKQWKQPRQRRISLYTAEDRRERAAVEARAQEAQEARTRRQQEHIDRTLEEELLVVPDEVRDALRVAYKTEKSKRSEVQVALLEEYPSVGNISPGSLYLYAQQRARRAGDIEKAAAEREAKYIAAAQQKLQADQSDQSAQAEQLVTAETLAEFDPEGFAEVQRYREAARICREQNAQAELAEMQEAVAAIRSTAPEERFVRVLTEPTNHTPPTHLFIRGDHNQLGPQLEPNELTVLTTFTPASIPVDDPELSTTGRRLAYARHLTSGEHPLLSRVLMNRVWMHHFGRGIVDTPGDFGRLGSAPTHPELLDWLADELMRSGWDLKRMHRLLMLSQTYRQSSARSETLDSVDPDNRLYARMSVRRLESEAIRDAMLAVNHSLLNQLHGPPVPVKEDAVGQIVIGKEMLDGERKPTGEELNSPGSSRRSVYIQVRRSRPLAVLETFDIATVSPNCTSRSYSNVSMQALLMMNSQFVIDQADRLAERMIATSDELPEQLSRAWQRCFGRPIEEPVLAELVQFVEKQAATFQSRDPKLAPETIDRMALATACQAMFSSNQFIYID